ncbi:MAG: hypothetical protein JWP14_2358 [Frankiales bacterium]|nr:hypothetical protein [Frankiales bacterium]
MSAAPLERPARVMPLRSPLPKEAPKRTSPLRLVPPRRSSAAKTPFAVVLVMLLGGGLLGLLLLNTLVAQQSFSIHDLGAKDKALQQREQDLSSQVQALEAPASLAARAAALHMVPSGPPAFLRLSDGKVLGSPQPGVAPVVVKPPVKAAPTGSTTWTGPKPTTTTTTTTTTVKPTGAHR